MTVATVRIDGDADWPVARLTGEVDLSNVEDLTAEVEAAVSNRALGLVLDLTDVTYLDSTGLRLIFRLLRKLQDRQQELCLVVPDDALILRVLRLGGVPDVVTVSSRLDQALSGARGAS